jgi:hypothetical protein
MVPPAGNRGGLTALYAELTRAVTTQTYANGFHVVALLCTAGALIGLATRSGRARPPRSTA